MKQTWKRLLSLLLACVLVVSALPLSASAQVSEPSEATKGWVSGICQNNYSDYGFGQYFQLGNSGVYWASAVKYQQTAEGVVTDTVLFIVPGEGATGEDAMMPDYNSTPELWAHGNVSALYIGDGVAGIGDYAFYNIPTLEKVVIEDSADLTKVGEHAFDGCDNLVGSLDLSNVTTLGQYAFNNCERLGSGENNTGVTLSDNLTEIPKNAFYNCALKKVNIPESCTEIGEGAFAHNSLSAVGELVLPDDLESIGDSAFYRQPSESTTMQGITSLVIPASVTYIGKNAFYGIKSLSQVELKRTIAEGLKIENGAFGINPMTAYNTTKTYEIEGIKYENVSVGAEFLTHSDEVADLLDNGVNCYTGNLKPLMYVRTEPATCASEGHDYYQMTLENVSHDGKPVTVETSKVILPVGHNYVEMPNVPATCTQAEKTHKHCTNKEKGLVETCEAEDVYQDAPGGQSALGHNYQVVEIQNPTISGDNRSDTVITYRCANWSEDKENNRHDGEESATYQWSIAKQTLTASTSHKLSDLALPTVTNVGHNSTALLEWNENETTLNQLLTAGPHTYKVKLVVISGNTFPECAGFEGHELQITVQVDKVKLDFSDVEFQNSTRFTGMNNPEFVVDGLPEGVTQGEIEYKKTGENEWTTEKPAELSAEDAANYQVRVHFTYTDSMYLMPGADEEAYLPDSDYILKGGNGEGTITGPYIVRALQSSDLTATPKNNLEYTGSAMPTVTIGGLPKDAEVTVSWEEDGIPKIENFDAEYTSHDVANITNAGSYPITITVESTAFAGGQATVRVTGTIAKKTVTTPNANTDLKPYDPMMEQTGVPDSTAPDIYTVTGNKATNAGTYNAKATLKDKNNYKWSTGDEEETGTVSISYTIYSRRVNKPGLSGTNFFYNNEYQIALTRENEGVLAGAFDDNGNVTAYWKEYGEDYLVYTATNVRKKDAGTYTIVVSLKNPEGVTNYQWADGSTGNLEYTWTISKLQFQAPTITAATTTYDGEAYEADKIKLQHSSAAGSLQGSEGIVTSLGSDHKYYKQPSGGEAMEGAPTDAGTYYVDADLVYDNQNYQMIGGGRVPFTINKANLTLTAPEEDQLTKTYTGQAITVPAPTISDYPDHGEQNAALTYTYKLKDSDDEANTAEGELKLTDVGTYIITVKVSDSCQNYTSENAAEYTFTINAANQTVELTSDTQGWNEDNSTVSKTLGDKPFTVTGKGYVGENPTPSNITYESSDSDTATVDEDGKVTLKKATAEGNSVTITVTAAGSDNYGQATATYTITVGKGTPTVTVQMPDGGSADSTYPYTGNALEITATVTGADDAVQPVVENNISLKFYKDHNGTKGEEILNGQPTEIGTYWVEAVYAGDDNYNEAASQAEKFTISPAALGVQATGYNDTYDGEEHAPAASITVKGVDGEISSDEYTVSYAKKTEGQESAPAAGSEEWKTNFQVKDVADSGEYWVKVVINNDASYNPYVSDEPITVKINPKPLTVSKTVTPTKVYDGTTKANVEIGTIATNIEGETVEADLVSAEYNSADVKNANTITITYKLTAEGAAKLANYSLDGKAVTGDEMSETVKDGVAITPASITVAISDQTSVYDGEEPEVGQEKGTGEDHNDWYVSTGTVFSQNNTPDDLGITLSIDAGSKNAGTYAITGKSDNDNYDVAFTGGWNVDDNNKGTAGTYTIDPRPIKVEIGDTEGFYGDEPDKTKVELTDISESDPDTGLVSGDSLDDFLSGVTIDATASTGVGNDYSIFGTAKVYDNYDVTFSSGTYTVRARPITITINDHSSDYGAAIDGGIASPVSGEDYTVAITEGNTTTTKDAIVNNDNLGITLTTTAQKGSDAGTYSISGNTQGDVVANYAITWKGETAFEDDSGTNTTMATYTVKKAELTVSAKQLAVYAQYGQETANPLTFTNASTDEEIAATDSNYEALNNAVRYTLNPKDSLTMGEENKAEGKFTVNVTDTTVTVTVNVGETDNFKAATQIMYYVYTSASGSLTVTLPFENLTYTSEEQQLLTGAPTLPKGVVIRYSLNGKDWTEYSDVDSDNWKSLVGTNAGDYTVYWETKAGGNYSASSGHETTEIQKANLKAAYEDLESGEVTLVLSAMGDTYTIPLDLTGNAGYTHSNGDGVTFLSGNTDVAFAKNSTATLELRGVAGEANITINCPGDNNYNPGTFTFTVTVTDEKAEIQYSAPAVTATYDGQPHTIQVNVTEPASGATVKYWNEETKAYDLSEPPAYVEVKRNGDSVEAYTIKFQITAPGYEIEEGTATLTISPKNINQCLVEGIAASYTFVNKPIEPQTVEVVDGSVILKEDTDYTITYGANTEVGEDKGSVIIKGTGNYTGEVTVYFNIAPVDGSSGMTASIDPAYDTYNSPGNTATVTVTHQMGSDSHPVDLTSGNVTYTFTATDLVTGQAITDHGATGTGDTLTFTKPAIYDITLTLTGDHRGEFHLSYTLLPLSNEDGGLTLTVDDETQKVFTYGDEIDSSGAAITVTADGNIVTDQCTLT